MALQLDPILQKYFDDPQIGRDRKNKVAGFLDSGELTEQQAAQIVSKKYPDRYRMPSVPEEPLMTPSQILAYGKQQPEGFLPTAMAAGTLPQTPIAGKRISYPVEIIGRSTRYGEQDEASIRGDELGWTAQQIEDYRSNATPEEKQQIRETSYGLSQAPPVPYYQPSERTDISAAVRKEEPIEQVEESKGIIDRFKNIVSPMAKVSATALPKGLGTQEDKEKKNSQVLNFLNAVWQRSGGQIIDSGIDYSVTQLSNAPGFAAALPHIIGGDVDGALVAWDAGTKKEPVYIFGQQRNKLLDEEGNYDLEGVGTRISGSMMKDAGAAANIVSFMDPKLAVSFWHNAFAGAMYGSGEEVEAGKGFASAMVSGVRDGLIQGTIAKLVGIAQKHSSKAKFTTKEQQLIDKGYTPDDAYLLSKMTPKQQALWKDYVKVQANYAAAGQQGDDVIRHASKEWDDFLTKGLKKADKVVKDNFDDMTKSLKGYKVNPKPLKDSFDDLIKDMRLKTVKVKGGGLVDDVKFKLDGSTFKAVTKEPVKKAIYQIDFKDSALEGIPSSMKKAINNIYATAQTTGTTASHLADKRAFINSVKSIAKGKMYTPSVEDKFFVTAKNQIDDIIGKSKVIPKATKNAYKQAVKDYSEFFRVRSMLMNKAVGKVGGDLVPRGDKVLRGIQQVNKDDYKAVVNVMNKLEKFGVKVPKDIMEKSQIASIVQKISGLSDRFGFKGQIQQAVTPPVGSKGGLMRAVGEKAYKAISGEMPKTAQQVLYEADEIVKGAWLQSEKPGIAQFSKEKLTRLIELLLNAERVGQYGIPKDVKGVTDMITGGVKTGVPIFTEGVRGATQSLVNNDTTGIPTNTVNEVPQYQEEDLITSSYRGR
jgi:hypothetical protein